MPDPIVIVDYDPAWPLEFERVRDRARRVALAVGGELDRGHGEVRATQNRFGGVTPHLSKLLD